MPRRLRAGEQGGGGAEAALEAGSLPERLCGSYLRMMHGGAAWLQAALGNQIENGKMMFIYQAQLAFDLWHGILPEIDKEIIKILDV